MQANYAIKQRKQPTQANNASKQRKQKSRTSQSVFENTYRHIIGGGTGAWIPHASSLGVQLREANMQGVKEEACQGVIQETNQGLTVDPRRHHEELCLS